MDACRRDSSSQVRDRCPHVPGRLSRRTGCCVLLREARSRSQGSPAAGAAISRLPPSVRELLCESLFHFSPVSSLSGAVTMWGPRWWPSSNRIDQKLASRGASLPERRELRFIRNFERRVAKKQPLDRLHYSEGPRCDSIRMGLFERRTPAHEHPRGSCRGRSYGLDTGRKAPSSARGSDRTPPYLPVAGILAYRNFPAPKKRSTGKNFSASRW